VNEAKTRLNQECERNRGPRNGIPHHVDFHQAAPSVSFEPQADGSAAQAANEVDDLVERAAARSLAVDRADGVAGPHASLEGRCSGEWVFDDGSAFEHRDLHADARVGPCLLLAQADERRWLKELRMRIEAGQHLRDGALQHR
jgi:hypothetical protein